MKLSDLDRFVTVLKAHASGDPDITFFKPRVEADGPVLEGESSRFVEFELAPAPEGDFHYAVWLHKVVACSPAIRAKVGDFSLPIVRIPFYKHNHEVAQP